MSESDVKQIQEWHSIVSLHRSEECIHDIISQKCAATPSAEAIAAWDGSLTYAELESLSTRLACRILQDVKPESFIGIVLNKSKWTAISFLAVLKAGSAVFLVDPSLPDQRIKRMCEIAGAAGVITSLDQVDRVSGFGFKIFIAEDREPPHTQLPKVSPNHAAYLGSTSGSSGDPKAVFASYSFVISVLDHMDALLNGGCLCIPSAEQVQNDLAGAITALNANFVEMTPSVARVIDPQSVPCLKTVVLTGEAATRADLDKWVGRVNLKTCYGQSENSQGTLLDSKTEASSPGDMGFPFAAHCWVVSTDSTQLVPIGEEGELWVESACLARGYLGNEEQTAAAFINDPAWFKKIYPEKSARFLRTGDLVRQCETGLFQYVGRLGTQVKLRGQRIELTEVEAQLGKQFPGCNAVAEIVKTGQDDNDAVLAAFIAVDDRADGPLFATTTPKFASQVQEAIVRIGEILPRFMIPQSFVPLTVLPLTLSGKLNRRLLREKAAELGGRLQTYHLLSTKKHRAPSSDEEFSLQRICADVLAIKQDISMDSTFFELGGNSLSAMKLVSKAREAGFSFTTSNIFQQFPLARLAEFRGDIVQKQTSDGSSARKERFMQSLPPDIDPENVADIFPCTQTQQWLFSNHDGGSMVFNFTGTLDSERLKRACQGLVAAHTSLRSVFIHHETLIQIVLKEITLPWAEHHTQDTASTTERISTECRTNAKQVFATNRLPMQFTLVTGPNKHALIIQLSHAQTDGSSQQTLISDLCALYKNPNAKIQHTDFIPYFEAIARRQTPESFSFWKSRLAGSSPTSLPLPPTNTQKESPRPVIYATSIPIKAPPVGITLATAIKAAWARTLQETTGQSDIRFAQLTSMRDADLGSESSSVPNLLRVLGPCINRVPVRVDFAKRLSYCRDQGQTVHDLFREIQNQYSECIPHQAAEYTSQTASENVSETLIMHQNFELSRRFELSPDLVCELGEWVATADPGDRFELMTEENHSTGELGVEAVASSAVCGSEEELGALVDRFCGILGVFLERPGAVLEGVSLINDRNSC
ncbi:hypothetical protein BDV18DRAFT_160789 [Aspergillus unguis]